ncbi:MAG: hypothetical protein K1X94_19740 [Sandaracinaceae bacterium]|nr:hypothetical protein [Sandaracinaceae bacterium]
MPPTQHSTTRAFSSARIAVSAQLALGTAAAFGLAGCNGAFFGNFVVLGLTLGVFFGTLGLGRARPANPPTPRPSSAESSHAE